MVVARGRTRRDGGLGAARRVAAGRAGRGGRARRPQRLRQDDAAQARLGHLQADLRPHRGRRARRLAARARRRLPPRLHRPRERLPERLDPRPLAGADPRADGRDRRVRRARALHRPARPDVLVGDVHAARLLRRGAHPGRRAAARRGVRRRRRGRSSASASGRSTSSSAAAGRSSSSRTTRRRSSVSATGRCCSARLGRLRRRDARGDRAVPAAARRATAAPTSSPPGCASGEAARRGSSRPGCSTPTATSGVQFAPGEPLGRRAAVASDEAMRRPAASRSSSATTTASRSAASATPTAELGWDGRRRRAQAPLRDRPAPARRRAVPPPLRARRRRRRPAAALATTTPSGSSSSPPAARPARSCSRDAGRCRRSATPSTIRQRMSSRTCPDWPQLMEIAPELQFKHYTLREAQLPADVARQHRGARLRRRRDLLRPREPRLLRRAHRPGGRRGAARIALVRPARVGGALTGLEHRLAPGRPPHCRARAPR